MSDKQVAVPESNSAVSLSCNREVEKESTEETTLSQKHKDLGDKQVLEQKADYKHNQTTSIVEDNRSHQSESSRQVSQSVTQEVSANRQVTKTSFSSSQSYEMEETEEYEFEG